MLRSYVGLHLVYRAVLAKGSDSTGLSVREQSLSEYDLFRGGGMANVRPVKDDDNMAAARADLRWSGGGRKKKTINIVPQK